MRLNKFLAHASGLSRRSADQAIEEGRVTINQKPARLGQAVAESDTVTLDGTPLKISQYQYVLFNKPTGYLSSRKSQSAPTVYELLPQELQQLKLVGRLDKDTSGLMLLTDDGDYANQLTHPKHQKTKRYRLQLDKYLTEKAQAAVNAGIELEDGISHLSVKPEAKGWYQVTMREGRNRQIRRTFAAIDYVVTKLHRIEFGPYSEADLGGSMYADVSKR